MTDRSIITESDIRNSLISRADAYAKAGRTSFSAIGIAAVGDSKFLSRVQSGLSFNIRTYQRVMDWLDVAEKSVRREAAE
ncbi:hypothetical protein [Agrobacterium sp. NPDC090273]|uniref:hypothetical protein n=1 Tax=Agrobacterium sp. NPDC090273 TaxID=3363919 RepID=UPI00383BCBF4